MAPDAKFVLDEPSSFLTWITQAKASGLANLDGISVAQAWALAGLAALARVNGGPTFRVTGDRASKLMRFADAIGFDDVVRGESSDISGDEGRTVRLRRITQVQTVEQTATVIGRVLFPNIPNIDESETQRSLHYVLVELMRNAVQHSTDPRGGVVGAQRMDAGFRDYNQECVQVVVADTGIGVLQALRKTYPDLPDARAALVKSLQPHVSGAFGPGRTGSAYNAGMGLFFISEMAKLTAGRLLLASHGAALLLTGHKEGYEKKRLRHLKLGLGFPGTLVAFELPIGEVRDHAALIETISAKARERTPKRDMAAWVRFEAPPVGTFDFVVSTIAEDIDGAGKVSKEQLQKRLFAREPVALDFRHVDVCTQSFLHALLYDAIRLSWAVQTPIYVENAAPSVKVGVALVDNYARGG